MDRAITILEDSFAVTAYARTHTNAVSDEMDFRRIKLGDALMKLIGDGRTYTVRRVDAVRRVDDMTIYQFQIFVKAGDDAR